MPGTRGGQRVGQHAYSLEMPSRAITLLEQISATSAPVGVSAARLTDRVADREPEPR